jgi:cardiolipin synthase (CMP-forming)
MFWTLPTIMTWTRIVAIPLIVGVFYLPIADPMRNVIATVMFIVFAATDWLDGFLARKLNQTSAFGAFLDPVADKFLVCASLLVLVAIPFLLYDGQLFGFIDTGLWGQWLIWVSAVLTVWSMVYYLQKAIPEIRARAK